MLKTNDSDRFTAEQAATFKAANRDYPLFWNKAGGWAKTIRGTRVYFGKTPPDAALARYHADRDYLERGELPPAYPQEAVAVRDACNEFLTAKKAAVESGELSHAAWDDYKRVCERVVKHFGRHRALANLTPADFLGLRQSLAKGRGLATLKRDIIQIRTLFKFAFEAGLVERPVRFGPSFKLPTASTMRRAKFEAGRLDFTPDEIRQLLESTTGQLHTMILLGVCAGLGNGDVAKLRIESMDLARGWLENRRSKTAVLRRAWLWPEVVEGLREIIADRESGRVFHTRLWNDWGYDDVSREFRKVLKRLGLAEGRRGFYSLRRSFRTIADEIGDDRAANLIMGHSDHSMASVYSSRIGDARLRRISEHVRAVVLGAEVGA